MSSRSSIDLEWRGAVMLFPIVSRRQLLGSVANGFGMLGLVDLLVGSAHGTTAHSGQGPHHLARARRVIFLFMNGGPSHVDLFDPKPRLTADHGKPLPF